MRWWLFSLVGFLLFIVIVLATEEQRPDPAVLAATCPGNTSLDNLSGCIRNLALEYKDPRVCESLRERQREFRMPTCKGMEGTLLEDCLSVELPQQVACVRQTAVAMDPLTGWQKVRNTVKRFLSIFFIRLEEELSPHAACEVLEPLTRSACLAEAGSGKIGSEACDHIEDGKRDDCLVTYAYESGDLTVCNEIRDATTKARCLERGAIGAVDVKACAGPNEGYCLQEIARSTKNFSVCLALEESYWRGSCMRASEDENVTAELCSSLTDDTGRAFCYYFLAIGTRDVETCNLMQPTREFVELYHVSPTGCRSKVIAAIGNAALCADDGCYYELAHELNESVHCYGIRFATTRDYCLNNLFLRTRNVSLCADVSTNLSRSSCYSSAARLLGDRAYCAYMMDETWMDRCLGHFGEV